MRPQSSLKYYLIDGQPQIESEIAGRKAWGYDIFTFSLTFPFKPLPIFIMATESLASTISDLEKGSINVSESKEKGGGYFSILIRPKMVEPHDSCEYSPQVKNGHRFALCDVKLEEFVQLLISYFLIF